MPKREINGCEMKSIKVVSEEVGMSQANIRKYTERGLISITKTEQESLKYGWYDGTAICRLRLIKIFRELGVPLKEIQENFEKTNRNHNDLLDDLITKLKKRRDEITHQIEFCEMAKIGGLKGMALIAATVGSIDTYIEECNKLIQINILPQIEGIADDGPWYVSVIQKIGQFHDISAYAPTSDEAQACMDGLIGDYEKLWWECMLGKSTASDCGIRIIALSTLVFLILSEGTITDKVREVAGQDATDYIMRAAVHCGFRTLESLCAILREEYLWCKSDESKREYLYIKRSQFCKWLSSYSTQMNLENDDDILEIVKDFSESESGDWCDPEDSEEFFQYIVEAWNKLPL